jgi:hypothetical protein
MEAAMKWILVFCCFLSANCASQTAALVSTNSPNQNNSANQTITNPNDLEKSLSENESKVHALEIQNEKFKTIPEEFRKFDFKNFTYPTNYPKRNVTLKNGKYKYENTDSLGGGWFDFGKVYFVDLTKDEKKEAIVFLSRVDCGGSCDGGTVLIYVYQSGAKKPTWKYEFGSKGYGCGLRTLNIEDKKIFFDVFGKCNEKMELSPSTPEGAFTGKFSFYGYTEFTYKFDGKQFVREKMEFHQIEKLSSLNYRPQISIND